MVHTRSLVLPPEAGPLSEPGLPSGGCAQHSCTARALDYRLRVGENGSDLEASLALDVHEVAVRGLYKALELVLLLLEGPRRVQKVDI